MDLIIPDWDCDPEPDELGTSEFLVSNQERDGWERFDPMAWVRRTLEKGAGTLS